ncbi:MAG TPA: hypothetical protein VIM89_21120 [Mucilaginibacter sp.]
MTDILNPIVNAIFNGAFVLLVCLLIINFFKINISLIKYKTLVNSVSCTLLLGSILYIFKFVIEFYVAFFSGGEYEQYAVSNRVLGPYWAVVSVSSFIPYILLPQLLWIKRLRSSLITLSVILFIPRLLYLFEGILFPGTKANWSMHYTWGAIIIDYLTSILIYLPILIGVYMILSRRERRLETTSTNL